MTTITEMRKKGWTCRNLKPNGSGYWLLKNHRGIEVEVDLGEERKWIVAIDGGREGWDAPTLGEALSSVLVHYSWNK